MCATLKEPQSGQAGLSPQRTCSKCSRQDSWSGNRWNTFIRCGQVCQAHIYLFRNIFEPILLHTKTGHNQRQAPGLRLTSALVSIYNTKGISSRGFSLETGEGRPAKVALASFLSKLCEPVQTSTLLGISSCTNTPPQSRTHRLGDISNRDWKLASDTVMNIYKPCLSFSENSCNSLANGNRSPFLYVFLLLWN